MKRAIFLDRDGTLIEERDYLSTPESVVLLPGVCGALRRLQAAGFLLFVITNQSGVGRGYFGLSELQRIHDHLLALLAAEGITIAKIDAATEAPWEPSPGRKPNPFFLFEASREFDIRLSESFVVGDKPSDLECGRNAGVKRSFLVRTGYGRKTESQLDLPNPEIEVVDDLAGVAESLLESGPLG